MKAQELESRFQITKKYSTPEEHFDLFAILVHKQKSLFDAEKRFLIVLYNCLSPNFPTDPSFSLMTTH